MLVGDQPRLRHRSRLGCERCLANDRRRNAPLRLRADVRAERDHAELGLAALDSGFDQDLQQSLAVEARREGLTNATDGAIDFDALAAKLIHLLAEAIAHLVELGCETGDLVVATNRKPV